MTKCLLATLAMLIATPAFAQGGVSLFKVISVKDEVTIGLNANELPPSAATMQARSRGRSRTRAR